MDKNGVKIIVAGQTASGKSSIMWAVIKCLQQQGIDVNLKPGEHKSIKHLQMSMEHDITLEERFKLLRDKLTVEVEEVNVNSENPTLKDVSVAITKKKK